MRSSAEHGFTKKYPSNGQSVKPSDKLLSVPNFDRVGPSHLVQGTIRVGHFVRNPGALLASPAGRATVNYANEVPVEAYFEVHFPQISLQPSGYMEFVELQDTARVGGPPKYDLAFVIPRENSVLVGVEEALRRQVASRRKQTVGLAAGIRYVRERLRRIVCADPVNV